MDILNKLLDLIPKDYQLPCVIGAFLIFYGYPRLSEYISRRGHWQRTKQNLEILKLIYETEAMEEGEQLGDLKQTIMSEIELATVSLKTTYVSLKLSVRFWLGALGAALAFLILGILYVPMYQPEASEIGMFALGAVILSVLGGLLTMCYRTAKKYRLVIFGGVSMYIVATVIGVFTPS